MQEKLSFYIIVCVVLQLQLCPPPVSPLCVIPNGVSRPHSEPLRDGTVLLELLGQLALDAERLVGRLRKERERQKIKTRDIFIIKQERTKLADREVNVGKDHRGNVSERALKMKMDLQSIKTLVQFSLKCKCKRDGKVLENAQNRSQCTELTKSV